MKQPKHQAHRISRAMRAIFRFLITRLPALVIMIGLSTPGCDSNHKVDSHPSGQFGYYRKTSPPTLKPWIKGEVILETEPLQENVRKQFQEVIAEAVEKGGGVRNINGSYRDGMMRIKVKFHGEGTIDDWAEVVRERLEQAKDKFPQGAIMPTVRVDYGTSNDDNRVEEMP